MLYAIKNRKTKNGFTPNEDSLTSSVFQLLCYLPPTDLWAILRDAIFDDGNNLPDYPGPLLEVEYWGKWNSAETTNARYVEPDLLLSFERIDLLIEAKRYDRKQQYREQWENNLRAYCNERGVPGADRPVVLIALGGIHNFTTDEVKLVIKVDPESGPSVEKIHTFPVLKASWTGLLGTIRRLEMRKIDAKTETGTNGIWMVYRDLITSFLLHGFFVGTWLEEPGLRSSYHASQFSKSTQRIQQWNTQNYLSTN